MTNTPKYWSKAKRYLSSKDKTMSKLIKNYKSPSETILTTRKDIFFSLCKSIIGQQISVAAANSVFLKFKKKCKNRINVKSVSKLTFSQLKSCGLSRQKVLGIKSLAKQIKDKSFIPLTFCLLRPQLFKLLNDNLLTVLAFILFLHFFLNFKKTELAAATLICCPIILLHSEKKTSLRVTRLPSL